MFDSFSHKDDASSTNAAVVKSVIVAAVVKDGNYFCDVCVVTTTITITIALT